jgi:hypothetical protein
MHRTAHDGNGVQLDGCDDIDIAGVGSGTHDTSSCAVRDAQIRERKSFMVGDRPHQPLQYYHRSEWRAKPGGEPYCFGDEPTNRVVDGN